MKEDNPTVVSSSLKCPFDNCSELTFGTEEQLGLHFQYKHKRKELCYMLQNMIASKTKEEETIPVSKIEARIKELEKNIGWDPATQKDLIVVKELKELLKK